MALNIKDKEAQKLAAEVAAMAGESKTRAVKVALQERKQRLALAAVVEETSGALSYWALRHPPGAPDFHHADGFVLALEPPDAPW